jgi:hypothetical protein
MKLESASSMHMHTAMKAAHAYKQCQAASGPPVQLTFGSNMCHKQQVLPERRPDLCCSAMHAVCLQK